MNIFEAPENSTVLVIADNPYLQDMMMWRLEKEQFTFFAAYNSIDGLERAKAMNPGVIVLDINMSKNDGWDALISLKTHPQLSGIPLILFSMIDDNNQQYIFGTAEYFEKPVDRRRIISVLKNYSNEGNDNNVLIIEDDPDQIELLKHSLKPNGFILEEAENGEKALEQISKKKPDLILLDLMMPVMDGFEFLERLRSKTEWESIPVILISAKKLSTDDYYRLNNNIINILEGRFKKRDDLIGNIIGYIKETLFKTKLTR